LILFRALQGVGAGGLIVGSQAIMGDVISPRQRGRYMGYFGAVFASTSVLGPLLGGVFTQDLSWRWVFYINIPVGIVALFVIAGVLHIPTKRTEHTVDYLGTTLLGAAVTTVVLLTTWGGTTYRWGSLPIIAMEVLTALLIGAFVVVESRAAEPLIPLGLFRIGVFNVTSSIGFVVGFIMFGAIIFVPLYLQTVHGATPTSAGFQLLPMVGGMLITFIVSGRLISGRGRYKVFPIFGTGVTTIGLYLLSLLTPTSSLAVSSFYLFIVGFGLGSVMQVLVVAVQNAVPYSQLGTATSCSTFFRSIGGVFGVALFGAIFNNRLLAALPRYLPASALRHQSTGSIAINPAQINALAPPLRHGYVEAFGHVIPSVFLFGVPFMAAAFGLAWLMKEVPLRTQPPLSLEASGPA
ncbi:MAG: MFS transporter, partial [Acidimicrobiales bacterium]